MSDAPSEAGLVKEPVPEFRTISLVIDHLVLDIPPSQYTQKAVFSTEHADEALISLIRYYDLGDLMLEQSTFNTIRHAANEEDAIYILVTPERIEAVASVETWDKMVWTEEFGNGSYLAACAMLTEAVLHHVKNRQNGESPLSVLSFGRVEAVDEPEAERVYTQAEVDALIESHRQYPAEDSKPARRKYARKARAR